MRIKVKSIDQIKEDMSHTHIDSILAYAGGIPEHFFIMFCGQWLDVVE